MSNNLSTSSSHHSEHFDADGYTAEAQTANGADRVEAQGWGTKGQRSHQPPDGEHAAEDASSAVKWSSDSLPVTQEHTNLSQPRAEKAERPNSGYRSVPHSRAADVWQMALSELALQMPSATYETWVRDTSVIAYEDGEFIIGTPNPYARDWLANRLYVAIKRILNKLLQRSVQVTFRVRAHGPTEEADEDLSPLYRKDSGSISQPHTTSDQAGSQDSAQSSQQQQWPQTPDQPPIQGQPDTGQFSGQQPSGQQTHGASWQERPHREQQNGTGHRPHGRVSNDPAQHQNENRNGPAVPAQTGTYSTWQEGRRENIGVQSTPLNPRYTFESFVVGNHNRLAHAAAQSVADHPGQRFNPLFVYGGVGLGKTHLLHAMGNHMACYGMRVLYCSSEQFTNDLIGSIRGQSTQEFRNKYRQTDLLLIDDIQFIGGKESTQEEFFHTFNHLHAAGRQVVISSDRPPKEIATLEARLRSRFEGGLQTDISQPDLETRVAILQSKAAATNADVPPDVLMLIAERVESNIRELEGALNRLIMQAPLYEGELNRRIAEEILDNLIPQRRPREVSGVLDLVSEHFRLSVEELKSRTRTKEVAYARQVAMYLLREENGLSLPNIGNILGGRDHSTVRYGVEKITTEMEDDDEMRRDVMTLRDQVYAPPASR